MARGHHLNAPSIEYFFVKDDDGGRATCEPDLKRSALSAHLFHKPNMICLRVHQLKMKHVRLPVVSYELTESLTTPARRTSAPLVEQLVHRGFPDVVRFPFTAINGISLDIDIVVLVTPDGSEQLDPEEIKRSTRVGSHHYL